MGSLSIQKSSQRACQMSYRTCFVIYLINLLIPKWKNGIKNKYIFNIKCKNTSLILYKLGDKFLS